MKISRLLDTLHVKIRQDDISKSRYRYIENFDISAAIRYDTIYRYRIDISIYRSITIVDAENT